MLHLDSHKGFAFVNFEEEEDAADAIDNMDGAELCGRVLKVHIAKPSKVANGKAVWATDDWIDSEVNADTNDNKIAAE